jgi:hypothetical protein
MVGTLGRVMGLRGDVTVNAVPQGEDGIMVCVLRSDRDHYSALPPSVALPSGLSDSPMADPAGRVVWVSVDYLRLLVTQISLFGNIASGGADLSAVDAVARTRVFSLGTFAELWQPGTSPALRDPMLALVWRGACGFVLAHEMAHVLLGTPPSLEPVLRDLPKRARQLAPICPALAGEAVVARRKYEERADSLALEAVLAGGAALGRGRIGLAGDFGIPTLLTLMLAADIVRIGSTTNSQFAQRMLEGDVGLEIASKLRKQNETTLKPETDLVRLYYSNTHPAVVQRLIGVTRSLAQRPGSLWYGDADPASDQERLLTLVEIGCAEAMREASHD